MLAQAEAVRAAAALERAEAELAAGEERCTRDFLAALGAAVARLVDDAEARAAIELAAKRAAVTAARERLARARERIEAGR